MFMCETFHQFLPFLGTSVSYESAPPMNILKLLLLPHSTSSYSLYGRKRECYIEYLLHTYHNGERLLSAP